MEFSLDNVPRVVADRIRIAVCEPQFLTNRRPGEWLIEELNRDPAACTPPTSQSKSKFQANRPPPTKKRSEACG